MGPGDRRDAMVDDVSRTGKEGVVRLGGGVVAPGGVATDDDGAVDVLVDAGGDVLAIGGDGKESRVEGDRGERGLGSGLGKSGAASQAVDGEGRGRRS